MGYRKKTLKLLYAILEKNYQDGMLYSTTSERSKRLFYKTFFRKLALKKRDFCKRIKYEIDVIENEIISMGGEVLDHANWKETADPIIPGNKSDKDDIIKDCYLREKQNTGMYNFLLKRINIGEIREMLLYQQHTLRQIIKEIESLDLLKYNGQNDEISNGGKPGGERNFGERQYG